VTSGGEKKRGEDEAERTPFGRLLATALVVSVIRDWTLARQKVEEEGCCRVCHATGRLEAAHIVGRAYDKDEEDVVIVDPDDVVPLCKACHAAFDARRLDLLPYLTRAEQSRAVLHAGIVGAMRRISGRRAA
jgi:5-methylcytosine-specific restriction endonuclease McrA